MTDEKGIRELIDWARKDPGRRNFEVDYYTTGQSGEFWVRLCSLRRGGWGPVHAGETLLSAAGEAIKAYGKKEWPND